MAEAKLSLLKLTRLPSRGRAQVASQRLASGQVLLQESPLLVYLDAHTASACTLCFHCSRNDPHANPSPSLSTANNPNSTWSLCPGCRVAAFCSPACAAASSASSHTPFVCKALSLLTLCTLDLNLQTQARFLVAAYNLAVIFPCAFEQLLSLQGEGSVDAKVQLVHSFLSEVIRSWQLEHQELYSWSADFVASLLAKDQINSFNLYTVTSDPHLRQVRAYALYAQASFFNHSCLPNACRFDYIDKPGVGNTDIIIRSLHDISEGAEVCISYFPIHRRLAERQKKLKEEYGFDCKCERCKIEGGRRDDDKAEQDKDISMEGEDAGKDEDMESTEEVMDAEGETDGSFPHATFLVKYLCPHEGCGGTLAPLLPEGGVSSAMECNVCGLHQSEDHFLQEKDKHRVSS